MTAMFVSGTAATDSRVRRKSSAVSESGGWSSLNSRMMLEAIVGPRQCWRIRQAGQLHAGPATNLQYLFEAAGWKVVSSSTGKLDIRDGVTIAGLRPSLIHLNELGTDAIKLLEAIDRSGDVAKIVEAWLRLNEWQAAFSVEVNDLKSNQILVRVGLKPNPYFRSPTRKADDAIELRRMTVLAPNANPNKHIRLEMRPGVEGGFSFSPGPK